MSAGAAAARGDPYLRVFAGTQSEGVVAVKWHEAMPPLPGLLVSFADLRWFVGTALLRCRSVLG